MLWIIDELRGAQWWNWPLLVRRGIARRKRLRRSLVHNVPLFLLRALIFGRREDESDEGSKARPNQKACESPHTNYFMLRMAHTIGTDPEWVARALACSIGFS